MIFKEIKDAVPIKDAAMFYGTEVKSSGMCKCPFHNDHHPSMKLYDKSFHCFGCGAHGDVIDFTERIFGLNTVQALKKLEEDFGISIGRDVKLSPAEKESRRIKANKALREHKLRSAFSLCMRDLRLLLIDVMNQLRLWNHRFAPTDPSVDPADWDERFVKSLMCMETIDHLINLIDFGENDERFELFKHKEEVKAYAAKLMSDGCPA